MKKIISLSLLIIICITVFVSCSDTSGKEKIIEITDVSGSKFVLTEEDLFYNFYQNAQYSGVLTNSWKSPSEIDSHYLIDFFTRQTSWVQANYDDVLIPQYLLEIYMMNYFDVESDHLRKSPQYVSDDGVYRLQGYPIDYKCSITDTTVDGNLVTIHYETYDYETQTKPVQKGFMIIQIDNPVTFKYISNTTTTESD